MSSAPQEAIRGAGPGTQLGDMPTAEFRVHAHRTIEWIADYLDRIEARPALSEAAPGWVRALLPNEPPREGESMESILDDLERVVLPGLTHWNHPGFFAYFNASTSGPGMLGELLAAAFNVNAMLWKTSPAATELEQVALGWLRQMLGLPEAFWGIIYEGGSASNLHALAAAREHALGPAVREQGVCGSDRPARLRLYTTGQTHSSIEKGMITLGLGRDAIRRIPADAEYRMRPDALARAIEEDRSAGWQPFCVVCNLGSTSCTSVDPVAEVAEVCEREGVWLHVDAAHGGPLALLEEKRALFAGWERADSITVNPHKWLFVPLDCSVLYTRRPEVLRRAFSLVPEYLRTERTGDGEDYMDYGITLGRRFRALKLAFVLRYFGQAGLTARIREHVRLAELFAGWIDAHPEFERLAPVPMSTLCFRARPNGIPEAALDDLNERLMDAVNGTGEVYLSHTKLEDRLTLRLSISGLRTEERHVHRAWETLQEKLRDVHPRSRAGASDSSPDAWSTRGSGTGS